jgi:hypothetical protein
MRRAQEIHLFNFFEIIYKYLFFSTLDERVTTRILRQVFIYLHENKVKYPKTTQFMSFLDSLLESEVKDRGAWNVSMRHQIRANYSQLRLVNNSISEEDKYLHQTDLERMFHKMESVSIRRINQIHQKLEAMVSGYTRIKRTLMRPPIMFQGR